MVNQTPCWHVLPLYPFWLLLPVNSCQCVKSHTLDPYSCLIKCNLKCLTPCWAHGHWGLETAIAAFKYIYPFCYQQNITQLSTELQGQTSSILQLKLYLPTTSSQVAPYYSETISESNPKLWKIGWKTWPWNQITWANQAYSRALCEFLSHVTLHGKVGTGHNCCG